MQLTPSRAPDMKAQKHAGSSHWWAQRLSSLVLIPLTLWFVFSVLGLIGVDHMNFLIWQSSLINSLLMALTIIVLFYHIEQGLRVVAEDYIHDKTLQFSAFLAIKFFVYISGITALLAIARIVFLEAN